MFPGSFKSLTVLVMLTASLALASCDMSLHRDVDHDPANITQEVLFEVSYTNYAWGYTCVGLWVDRDGTVRRYDHSDEVWSPGVDTFYTLSELQEKYAHNSTVVDSVFPGALAAQYVLIQPASVGPMTESVHQCTDFGTISFRAYRVGEDTTRYYPVTLYVAGDYSQKNLSGAAEMLFEWLQTLNDGAYADPSCGYPDEE